ncbi:hypothetical protein FA13DRAFT_1619352 [Coprinellus micaceus]|uniref:F-box domain-containing protein n=1 Tax=Coprinellus micaceus TaxID=71717 RepID=A0A4Y7U0N5_COPMI|nr:hypothetical protein FA13DRAFT_1619352 [Coprinellus micaceus]
MLEFHDLPVDILTIVLGFLVKPNHLASAAKVNKIWNEFVTPRLYERVSIFSWHKESKKIVRLLFATLASYRHLAKHIRRLEIRDFPKAIFDPSGRDLHDDTVTGLKNCTNLHSCTWTRDGSLTSGILTTFASLPKLRELEINGHDARYYDPKLLCQFSVLQKISVIMPSPLVVRNIRDMVKVSGEKLRSLTMICKASGAVTDSILEDMAPTLVNLESFSLTGCPKVTERGVLAIVSSTCVGLKVLGLENVSTKFDMPGFSEHCKHAQSLHSLTSITLTVSQHISDPNTWTKSVASLLSHSPLLSKFHIYSTYITASESMFPDRDLPDLASKVKNARSAPCALAIALARFWTDLVAAHGDTLRRFSVLRMPISLESIKELCAGCPNLEELFVVANARSVNALPEALTAATKLKTIHVNFPVRSPPVFGVHGVHDNGPEAGEEDEAGGAATGTRTYLVPAEALEIAKRCGPSLTQFGCNTRVWKVGRRTKREEDGSVSAEVVLLPYEDPDIPEPFLVVRA